LAHRLVGLGSGPCHGVPGFHRRGNPAAARRIIQKLFDRVDTLAEFPHLGRPLLSGIDPTLRRIVFGSYVVVYQAVESAQTISIVAIRHSRERSLPQEEPSE
jgi:plasmid stabilization system protein ParE